MRRLLSSHHSYFAPCAAFSTFWAESPFAQKVGVFGDYLGKVLPPHSPELQPAEHLWLLTQYVADQPPYREHRGAGGGATGALCGSPTPVRAHPLYHALPLVAAAPQETTGTQEKLLSCTDTRSFGPRSRHAHSRSTSSAPFCSCLHGRGGE